MKKIQTAKNILPCFTAKRLRACCLGAALLSAPAYAETNLWTGARTVQGTAPVVGSVVNGDANWSSEFDDGGPSNWAVPLPNPDEPRSIPKHDGTADIQFNGTVGLTPVVDQAPEGKNRVDWRIHTMTFGQAATNTFTLFGQGHPLTINAGVVNNSPTRQDLGDIFHTLPIVLGGSQTWSANTGDIYIDLGTGAGVTLGNNDLTIAGSSNTIILPRVIGSGNLIKSGMGTLFLGGSASFNSLFTGAVTINGGILQIDGAGTA